MRKALKDYAQGPEGKEDLPVQEKSELFKLLDDAIAQGMAFCAGLGVDLAALLEGKDVFKNVGAFQEYANTLLARDEWREGFAVYENTITGLYEACKPDILGKPAVRTVAVFQYLRGVVDSIVEQADLDAVALRVSELLDESLVAEESAGLRAETSRYQIAQSGRVLDLSKMDFEKLQEEFQCTAHKNIEIADLRAFIQNKLDQMLRQNATRVDFATRLQAIIDRYNAGSSSADNYFNELVQFARDLKAEAERHVVEDLTEDELELFDLLKKEKMTKEEAQRVRLAAKSLLQRLREGVPKVLVQDWERHPQSRETVRAAVSKVLNDSLPETYDRPLFVQKCDDVFASMVNYANQGQKWVASA
jgi:type I restriction enzyme R subunit